MARYLKDSVNNNWDKFQDRDTSPVREDRSFEYTTAELIKSLKSCIKLRSDSAGANETADIFGRRYLAMLQQRGMSDDAIREALK